MPAGGRNPRSLEHNAAQTSAADIAHLSDELGLSRDTVFRLIRRFRESGTAMVLVDRKRGRPIGHRALDGRREEIIQQAIRTYYLQPTRPPVAQLVRDIQPGRR